MKTTSPAPFLSNVSSRYGAPMGRRNVLPADLSTVCALSLSFVPFVDGDYDAGGAYWGGAPEAGALFCAWGESEAGEPVEFYARAASYAEAAALVGERFPAATVEQAGLSDFARAYVEAALWLMSEDDDGSKTVDDIAPDTLAEMAREADEWAARNRGDITAANLDDTRAGHCYWLNRNGHGSGFWDEKPSNAPQSERDACGRLSEASTGERNLWRGDDDKIYQE